MRGLLSLLRHSGARDVWLLCGAQNMVSRCTFPDDKIMNHGGPHKLAKVREYMEASVLRVFLIIAPLVLGKEDARQRHHVIALRLSLIHI